MKVELEHGRVQFFLNTFHSIDMRCNGRRGSRKCSVKISVVDHLIMYLQYYYNQYFYSSYPITDFIDQNGGPVFPEPAQVIPIKLNVLQE